MKHTFFIGYNMYRRIQIDMKRLIFLTAVLALFITTSNGSAAYAAEDSMELGNS